MNTDTPTVAEIVLAKHTQAKGRNVTTAWKAAFQELASLMANDTPEPPDATLVHLKFPLGSRVWFMHKNAPLQSKVLTACYRCGAPEGRPWQTTEYKVQIPACNKVEFEELNESLCFATKAELLASF